ncbi:glycoside hydrolase family 26 protein [Symbioplanes lichenis]|uniref:glycoside hydrolase family 26 protein n=1 Tax=Symbioplanes lichenis TaxID=1629072 RepID=UPI002738C1DD|nr:glycosyl hydrolase [Actinoplanes lichenis]
MKGAHRARSRLTRRHLFGLAAVVAVPAAGAYGIQRLRDDQKPAEAHTEAAAPAASASVVPKAVATSGGTVPFRSGKALLGAYLDLSGLTQAQAVALRKRQTGRDERILQVFFDFYDTLPTQVAGLPEHAFPMVSWRGTAYSEITSGKSDDLIAKAARRLKAQGRPVLLRWAWEMNGDWYKWGAYRNGNDNKGFVQSWRRIHGIFADEGADNVSWVWSPNWNSVPVREWNTYEALYPGDKYVDWVGVSGYNLHKEKPETLFDPIYEAFGARKPIMICEVGAVDRGGSTKGEWITLLADWVEKHPAVGAVVFFDTDTHPGYDEKWRIDTNPDSLAAYVALAKRARFSG